MASQSSVVVFPPDFAAQQPMPLGGGGASASGSPSSPQSIASPTTYDLPPGTPIDAEPISLKRRVRFRLVCPAVALVALCLLALLLSAIRVADTAARMRSRVDGVVSAAEQDASGTFRAVANASALGSLSLLRKHAATLLEHELKNRSLRAHEDLCEAGFVQYATTAASSSEPAVTVADLAAQLVWSQFEDNDNDDESASGIQSRNDYWSVLCVRKSTATACDITTVGCVAGRTLPDAFGFIRLNSSGGSSAGSFVSFIVNDGGKKLLVSKFDTAPSSSSSPTVLEWSVAEDRSASPPADYTSLSRAYNASSTHVAWPAAASTTTLDLFSVTTTDTISLGSTAAQLVSDSQSAALAVVDVVVTDKNSRIRTVSRTATSELLARISETLGTRMRGSGVGGAAATTALFVAVNGSAAVSSTTNVVVSAVLGGTSAQSVVSGWTDAPVPTRVAMDRASGAGGSAVLLLSSATAAPASTSSPLVAAVAIGNCVSAATANSGYFSLDTAFAAKLPAVTCGVALGWDAFAADARAIIAEHVGSRADNSVLAVALICALVSLAILVVCALLTRHLVEASQVVHNALLVASRVVNAAGVLDTQRLTFFETPEELAEEAQREDEIKRRRLADLAAASANASPAGSPQGSPLTPNSVAGSASVFSDRHPLNAAVSQKRKQSVLGDDEDDVVVVNPLASPPVHRRQQAAEHTGSGDYSSEGESETPQQQSTGRNQSTQQQQQQQRDGSGVNTKSDSNSTSGTNLTAQDSGRAAGGAPPPPHTLSSELGPAAAVRSGGDSGSGSLGASPGGAGGDDIGARWAAEHHSDQAFQDAMRGSFGSAPSFGAFGGSAAGFPGGGALVVDNTSFVSGVAPSNVSGSTQQPGGVSSASHSGMTFTNNNSMAHSGGLAAQNGSFGSNHGGAAFGAAQAAVAPFAAASNGSVLGGDATGTPTAAGASSSIFNNVAAGSGTSRSRRLGNKVQGGPLMAAFNASEPLSAVREVAELQMRLNRLCAAAVESRTVIPAVAFDLFYAQFGAAQQRATSLEAARLEEALFLQDFDDDDPVAEQLRRRQEQAEQARQQRVEQDQLMLMLDEGPRSGTPGQQMQQGGGANGIISLRNSPQANSLVVPPIGGSGGGGAAAEEMAFMHDGSPGGSALLPQIKVQQGDESMTSLPNASLGEHPLGDGSQSQHQQQHQQHQNNPNSSQHHQGSPGLESLAAFATGGAVPPGCPLRPQRRAVVLCATIAGFLQLCEDENLHDARALSQLFLNVATKWVHDNGGTLLRVSADNVVATWGAILPVPDAELKASMCAMDISETLHNMRTKLRFDFDWTCIVLSGPVVAGSAGTVAEKTSVIYGRVMDLLDELPSLMTALRAPVVISAEVKDKVLPPLHLLHRSGAAGGSAINSMKSMHHQWHAFPIDKLSLVTMEDPDTPLGEVRLYELRLGPSKEYVTNGVERCFQLLTGGGGGEHDAERACQQFHQLVAEFTEEAVQDEQLLRLYRIALWAQMQGGGGVPYLRATPLWQRNMAEMAQVAGPFGGMDPFSEQAAAAGGVDEDDDGPLGGPFGASQLTAAGVGGGGGGPSLSSHSGSSLMSDDRMQPSIGSGSMLETAGSSSGHTPMRQRGAAHQSGLTPQRSAGTVGFISNSSFAASVNGGSGAQHLSPFGAPGSRRYDQNMARRRSTHIDDALRQQLLNFSTQFNAPKPTSRVPSRMSRCATPSMPSGDASSNQLGVPGGGGAGAVLGGFPSRAASSLSHRAGSSLAGNTWASSNSGGNRSRRQSVSFAASMNSGPGNATAAAQAAAGTSPGGNSLASPQQASLMLQLRSTGSSPRATPLPGIGSGGASPGSGSVKKESPTASVNFTGVRLPLGGSPMASSLMSASAGGGGPHHYRSAVPQVPALPTANSSGGSSPRESPGKRAMNNSFPSGMGLPVATVAPPLIQVTGANDSATGSREQSREPQHGSSPKLPVAAPPLNVAQLQQQQQRQSSVNFLNNTSTTLGDRDSSPSNDGAAAGGGSSHSNSSPSPPRSSFGQSINSPPAVNPSSRAAGLAEANATPGSKSPSAHGGGGSSSPNSNNNNSKSYMIKDRKGLTFRVSESTSLGKGAFGEVFMGLTETGIPVAVKVVNVPGVDDAAKNAAAAAAEDAKPSPKPAGGGVAARRAKRKGQAVAKSDDVRKDIEQVLIEVTVLSQLRHENIVGYMSSAVLRMYDKDTQQVKTKLALIMEFIPGGSLAGLMSKLRTSLNEQTAIHYLRDILYGLQFLHKHGFVHRDLKPANVLLLSDGSCKLTDFGTTVNIGKLSGETDMMGTPQYMAPEACRGETPTAATDVWAFGIVMAELLIGHVPWREEPGVPYQPVRFIYQIGHVETKVPNLSAEDGSGRCAVPPAAERIIMACCQRDQSKRPTVAQILAMDYFARMDARLSRGLSSQGGGGGSNAGLDGLQYGGGGGEHRSVGRSQSGATSLAVSLNPGAFPSHLAAHGQHHHHFAGRSPTRSLGNVRSPGSLGGTLGASSAAAIGLGASFSAAGGMALGASLRVPSSGRTPRSQSPGEVSRASSANVSGKTSPHHDLEINDTDESTKAQEHGSGTQLKRRNVSGSDAAHARRPSGGGHLGVLSMFPSYVTEGDDEEHDDHEGHGRGGDRLAARSPNAHLHSSVNSNSSFLHDNADDLAAAAASASASSSAASREAEMSRTAHDAGLQQRRNTTQLVELFGTSSNSSSPNESRRL